MAALSLVASALGLPMERSMRTKLSPEAKNSMMLSPTQEIDYSYWNQLTPGDAKVALKPLLPAELLLQKTSIGYNPDRYTDSTCLDWCSGTVKIDRGPAEAAGRKHFPSDDVADWAEKCSWDDYCAGCKPCGDPQTTCVSMCDVIADPEATPHWKQETRSYEELCNWGVCHGCDECGSSSAGASPVCSGTERLLYVDVDLGHAIEGFTLSKVYYTVGVCECEAACDDLPDCVAFVDNKKPNSGAPACSLKSSSSTLHEASDVTAKDVYYKPHHAPPSLTTSPPSPSAPLPIHEAPAAPPPAAPPVVAPSHPPGCISVADASNFTYTAACYAVVPSTGQVCDKYYTTLGSKVGYLCKSMAGKDQCTADKSIEYTFC